LFKAGDHAPVTPFVDVVGNAVRAAPWQIGLTELKVGVVDGFTVTATVFVKVLTALSQFVIAIEAVYVVFVVGQTFIAPNVLVPIVPVGPVQVIV